MKVANQHDYLGFTIVELLVVIVVIGILATITIVSYTGISQKAVTSSLQSDLSNAKKLINLYYVDNGVYPTDFLSNCPRNSVGTADNRYCIKFSSNTSYDYVVNNNQNPTSFCLTATSSSLISYKVTESTSPTLGDGITYGLVRYWSLDNVSGITDLSSGGNNGVVGGGIVIGTVSDQREQSNGATLFDGISNKVNVNITLTNTFSVSMWIKPINSDFWGGLIVKDGGTGIYYYKGATEATTNRVTYYYSGGGSKPSDTVMTLNQWHYLTIVNNGGSLIYYLDGQANGTASNAPGMNVLNIGTDNATATQSFGGHMADVRIYNRVLSQHEITQLYGL